MGYMHQVFFGSKGVYACRDCHTHIALRSKVESRQYTGQYGRAILFVDVVNVRKGDEDKRSMTTGVHIVRDIYCMKCNKYVGWTYVKAFEPDQRFKEGKFILERELIYDVTREWGMC
ncbi:protein yippee-like moh1 [Coemansia spiralis]|nr:protein yippee-like moh1 [Coemansia spiralis]